jgi:hypothetical protein
MRRSKVAFQKQYDTASTRSPRSEEAPLSRGKFRNIQQQFHGLTGRVTVVSLVDVMVFPPITGSPRKGTRSLGVPPQPGLLLIGLW